MGFLILLGSIVAAFAYGGAIVGLLWLILIAILAR